MSRTTRIALDLDVDTHPDQPEPSEWDLADLQAALRSGVARPRRLIRARVIDEEQDRLSAVLRGLADDLDADLQLHWLSSASPGAVIAPVPGSPRPSLETLIDLQALVVQARRLAERLAGEGL